MNLKRSLKRACREPRGVSVGNLLRRVWGLDGEAGTGRDRGEGHVPSGSLASVGPAGTSRINHS